MAFPSGPVEGEVYYTEKYVFEYSEGKWDSRVLTLAELNPNLGETRGAFFPPFSAVATLRTRLSCADGKILFSQDKINFQSTITVDIGDRFFAEWGTDIVNNAPQGSGYSSTVTVEYLDLSMDEEIKVNISSIDKVPDPFSFISQSDTLSDVMLEANVLAMLGSINAPTHLWGSSDSTQAEVNIADTGWQAIPTSFASALKITSKDEIRTRHRSSISASTATTTTLNIGYGTAGGEFQTADFVTTTEPQVVNQPVITSPVNSEVVDMNRFVIQASAFISQNAGVHESSDWYIARDSGFTDIVAQSIGDTSNLESWTPNLAFTTEETWYLRVRYNGSINNVSSLFSDTIVVDAQVFYNWRATVELRGADGASTGAPGGAGGQGTFTIESLTYGTNTLAGMAPFLPDVTLRGEVAAFANGGGSPRGGNSSAVLIGGTVIAVAGGGGAAGQKNRSMQGGGGGRGGHIGESGVSGGNAFMSRDGRTETSSGGSGGAVGSQRGGGGGSSSATGTNFDNDGTFFSGGGGGGGAGGSGGSARSGPANEEFGDTGAFRRDKDALVAGGGGGGGFYIGDTIVQGVQISNPLTSSAGGSTQHVTLRIERSTDGTNYSEFLSKQTYSSTTDVNLKTITTD